VLQLGRFGKYIRITWKVLKCGVGEGTKSSVGMIVRKMEKYYIQPRRKGISYIGYNKTK
jgi:hypothetical protein